MEYAIYKMKFLTGLHIGNTLLEDSEMTIHADTLFSALCHQALLMGGEEKLREFYEMANEGDILISDLMPYDKENYYIPKPMVNRDFSDRDDDGSSEKKKQDKKMKFVPISEINKYINGDMDAKLINEKIGKIGKRELRTLANVRSGEKDTKPFHVGVYHFSDGCGLYFVAGTNGKDSKQLLNDLLISIDSIGGERSSGLGRFELTEQEMEADFAKRLQGDFSVYVNLSVALPEDDELDDVLKGANCSLIRRGGFVASVTYAEEVRRKRDLYVFAAGSAFQKKFEGTIRDVAVNLSHPVYRYAKPIWLGVNL